jgi:hypothetical protein
VRRNGAYVAFEDGLGFLPGIDVGSPGIAMPPEVFPGDVNLDGQVNGLDIDPKDKNTSAVWILLVHLALGKSVADPAKNSRERAIAVFRRDGGMRRTKDALAAGIHPPTLYGLYDEGVVERLSRGL